MTSTELVLERLEGVKRAAGGWIARCPAHADKHPSLSVREGDDGRVLLHCFAGCTVDAVTAAIGRSTADLFEPNGNGLVEQRPRIVATYDYYDETGSERLATIQGR